MAGTLLSGWRIRLFDPAGNPLYPGRVQFFDATTSLPKTVYENKDLNIALGTTVETDIEGYLPAIWLDAGYYKADVQLRIQEDPETWSTLWNINNLGVELIGEGGAGTGVLAFCQNIAEMKAIVAGTVDAVICAGYYNAGDCGNPLFFTWQASSTKTDDAGAYIRSNDTPSGTAGRYHQVFPTGTLDIRKWGGIPNSNETDCLGALINMSNYAVDYEIFPNFPPEIGFVAPGSYYFSGSINLNRIWTNSYGDWSVSVPYYIGMGVQIVGMSYGLGVTITNPTRIDTDTNIVEYPTGIDFIEGSVEYIRPQWLANYSGNLADKIANSLGWNIPVRVFGRYAEGEVDIDSSVNWDSTVSITIESSTLYFKSDSGDSIYITAPLIIPNNQYIFRCTTYISDQELNAAWFGYGYLSGVDQAPALQAAINASNGQAPIRVPRLRDANQRVNSAVNGDAHSFTHTLILDNYIQFGENGSLVGVYLDVPFNQSCLSVPSTNNNIILMNPTISPYWFGAKEGNFEGLTNDNALLRTLFCGARGRNVVDGGGGIFVINSVLYGEFSGSALVSWKNITINPSSSYNATTYPTMIGIHGGIDLEFESVNVNTTLKANVASVYFNTYWARVRNCYFGQDLSFGDQCEDYAFTNNQVWGEVGGTNFMSASKGAIITGNTFTHCRIHLLGDNSIQSGYTFPMLQNMVFSNNIVQNIDQQPFRGCVYLVSRATNTLVNGLNITDNIFAGNIPAWSNSGANPPESYKFRINDTFWNGGTWAVSQQSDNDVRHLMVIKNNTYQWYIPAHDVPTPEYPYNREGHRQNYLPSTTGTESGSFTFSSASASNSIFRNTFAWSPSRENVFMLTGDTTSQFSTNYTTIKGWRRKTGEHTWDVMQPCDAHMYIGGVKANSSGTAYVDINRYQWGAVSGSTGWVGSNISYDWTWCIYEEF